MTKQYIEREMAIETLYYNVDETCSAVVSDFEAIPAADVAEVVHGNWIPLRESEITGWNPGFAGHDPIGGYKCSNCNKEAVFDCNDSFVLSDYCPNCGAKMDGDR